MCMDVFSCISVKKRCGGSRNTCDENNVSNQSIWGASMVVGINLKRGREGKGEKRGRRQRERKKGKREGKGKERGKMRDRSQ